MVKQLPLPTPFPSNVETEKMTFLPKSRVALSLTCDPHIKSLMLANMQFFNTVHTQRMRTKTKGSGTDQSKNHNK